MLLSNRVKYLGTFRTIFYYPAVIPIIAVGLIWYNLYSKSNGIFNDIIVRLGMDAFEFRKGGTAVVSLMAVLLWGAGASLLVFLAALKNVPVELYESAEIEGANYMQKFWKITFPIISPTLYFQIITSFIYNLQLHVQPVMIFAETGASVGGTGTLVSTPARSLYTAVTQIYQQVFVYSRYGYGVSIVWITFIAILILTQIIMRTSRFWVFYEVDQDKR
jgi:multiple sugar transport system permease protein